MGNTSVKAVHLSGGTLRRSIVRGNNCTGAPVVGCYKSTGGRSSRAENCLLADNQGSSAAVLDFSQSILLNSTVTRNRSQNKANVVLRNYGAVTIENCAISNNVGKATVWVEVFWGSEGTTMRNSLVADNENGAFAAVVLNDWSMRCWMENCTIANNRPRVRNKGVDMGCYEDPLGKGVMVILR